MQCTPWALNNCGLFSMERIYGSYDYPGGKKSMQRFLIDFSNAIKKGISSSSCPHLFAHRVMFSLASDREINTNWGTEGHAFLLRYSKLLWKGTNTSHGYNHTYIYLMDLRPLVGTLITHTGELLPVHYMSYRFRKWFDPEERPTKKNLVLTKIKRSYDGGKMRRVTSPQGIPTPITIGSNGKYNSVKVKFHAHWD